MMIKKFYHLVKTKETSIEPDISFLTKTAKDLNQLLESIPQVVLNSKNTESDNDDINTFDENEEKETTELLQKQLDTLRDPNCDTSGGSELIEELVNPHILDNTLKKLRENEILKLREKIKNMEEKITVLEVNKKP